jgi:regulator of sigma E protease
VPFRVRREGEVVNLRIAIKRDPDLGLRVRKFELGESTYIRSVEDGSPARQSGLEVGDKIISANGEPVLNANHLIEIVRGMAGKPVAVEYERKGARLKAAVTPFYDTVKKRARIGIGLGFDPLAPKVIVHPSPLDQLWRPVVNITRTLWALFHPQVTGVTPGKLSGAPGIMYVLTQQIKESIMIGLDWTVFLNVNLAIINLLPLPVLDGGHILFALFEWIRRRPLNVKFVRVTWTGFTALLLAFVLYVSVKDLWMITRISFMKPAATGTNVAPAAPAPSPAR